MRYESDAIIAIEAGRITHFGAAGEVLPQLAAGIPVRVTGRDTLISAGSSTATCTTRRRRSSDRMASSSWTGSTSTPSSQNRRSPRPNTRRSAEVFLDECLRAGTTTAAVYCAVHPQSVDAFFEAAAARNLRMIAGKALMDRHAPAALTDTARSGYDQSRALISRWHGRGRALYAVTPRFAASSTRTDGDGGTVVGRASRNLPAVTCIGESRRVAWIRKLYPEQQGYLDVYDHFGHLGPRAIYGHGIWLTEEELRRCHESGTAIAHCPTSNLFLGSGLFSVANAMG